uniref:Uncharacterized protein n=1 Tax=Timema bartmani TaxID=61472 RepID=A0A7R9I6T5_9NEOP|nr:unnamed protein product [Timema bartmani]
MAEVAEMLGLERQLALGESNAIAKKRKEKQEFIEDTIETFNEAGILLEKLDNPTKYKTKSAGTLKDVLGPHVSHIKCWTQKINLVGQIWQNGFNELNTIVVKTKNPFNNTWKRRSPYVNLLTKKYSEYKTKVKLFPMPVQTRWNTWFSVLYLDMHLDDIHEFFDNISDDSNNVRYMKNLSSIELDEIKVQASFVAGACNKLKKLIDLLEESSYSTGHALYSKINYLKTSLTLSANV